MLTGGLGYSYNVTSTLPLTQTNLADYPVSPCGRDSTASSTAVEQPNQIGGLIVIAPERAEGGDRLHRPPGDRRGRALQQVPPGTRRLHRRRPSTAGSAMTARPAPGAIVRTRPAAAGRRTPPASSTRSTRAPSARQSSPGTPRHVGESFADVKFPGVLKECEGCHVRGTYDFSAAASQSALPNRLYRTVGAPASSTARPDTTITTYSRRELHGGHVGGPDRAGRLLAVAVHHRGCTQLRHRLQLQCRAHGGQLCTPDGTQCRNPAGRHGRGGPADLVNSPIATACFACHDSPLARSHMEINGGFDLRAAQHRAGARPRPAWSATTRVGSRTSRSCTRSSRSCRSGPGCGC